MKQTLSDLPGKVIALLILLGALVLAFFTLKILLIPLVAASFLAYLFDPAIVVLQRRGMGRGVAYLLLLVVSVLGIAVLVASAPSWLQLESISAAGNEGGFAERLEKQISDAERALDKRFPMFKSIDMSSKAAVKAAAAAEHLFEQLPGLMTAFLLNLLLVPVIAYFMVRDGRTLRRRIVQVVPNRYFEMTLIMLHRIDEQIGGYLRGRIIECMLVAVTQAIAMGITASFVEQRQILLISFVCGITNLIPYVGPLMGVGFGALLYLGAYGMPMSAVYGLLIASFAAHLVDNVAIAPVVLSHNVDLHPLTVALVLVIGGELLGILGLLIAIPVAASIKVIAQEFYSNYRMRAAPDN